MSRICQVTGKKPARGCRYAIRGIAKKKKGIGLKTTGITSRTFQPNLMKKRFWFDDEDRFVTLKLSAAAMRTINKNGLSSVIRNMRKEGQVI